MAKIIINTAFAEAVERFIEEQEKEVMKMKAKDGIKLGKAAAEGFAEGLRTGEKKVAKYRKKPVVIEAVQWSGENILEMEKFAATKVEYAINGCLLVDTLEGVMKADVGDYIIKGVNGEFYPCKPDIFKKTYDYVGE